MDQWEFQDPKLEVPIYIYIYLYLYIYLYIYIYIRPIFQLTAMFQGISPQNMAQTDPVFQLQSKGYDMNNITVKTFENKLFYDGDGDDYYTMTMRISWW